MRHRTLATAAIAVMTLGLFSCDSPPTAPRLNQLTLDVVSGDGQTGVVGTEVAPLIVIVRSNGNPVPLQVLNFRVVSGGGSVYGGTELTDNNGIAQEIWTLGTSVSQPQKVEVRAVESSTGAQKVFATFTATALADRAYSLSAVAGTNQTAVAGSAVPISPAVRVADQYGNPIGGVNVAFAVGPASGSATGLLQTTDANGTAAVGTWTLSGTAGPNTLLATTPGVIVAGRPVTFTAVGITGNAAQLAVLSGNNQAASPGATLPNQPTVRVMDANGNGVPNVAVTFTVTGGGGSIGGVGSVTTLTATGGPGVLAGSAAVTWTLGSAAGTNTLQATAVGLSGSPLVFSATVVPPPTLTSFTAAASTITAGTSTTLTGVFSGGTGAIDHGVGAVTSGTPVSTGPVAASTIYTLTVTNSVGVSVSATLTVTTVPPPTIASFSAADPSLPSGNSTTLTAVFSGGNGVIDHGISAVASGVPASTGPLTATTTYTLTVTNSVGASATATVTVTVSFWTTKASMPTPRTGAAAGVINGLLYVVGGGDAAGSAASKRANEAYDPMTNTWVAKAPDPIQNGAGTGVAYAAAGVIAGKLYVVGGCVFSDCIPGNTNILEVYDPATDTWTSKAPMPTARNALAAGVIAGRLYVVGGQGQCGPCIPTAVLEVYDPTTDIWAIKASMPTARSHLTAAVVNGVLYAIGGAGSAGNIATVEAYDPGTDTWTTKTAIPTPRSDAASGVLNGLIYVAGGYNSAGTALNTVEAYDPIANAWRIQGPMPTARAGLVGGVVSGHLYAVGGFNATGVLATNEVFQP